MHFQKNEVNLSEKEGITIMRLSQDEILEFISQKKYAEAQAELSEWNDSDVAAFMEDVPRAESLKIFRILPKDMAADVFSKLPLQTQQDLITSLTDEEMDRIVEDMYADDAADLLEEIPSNVVKRILAAANPKTRNDINQLLQYPRGSAGAIMTVEYVSFKENWTVEQALQRIRHMQDRNENVNVCYVLTATRKLVGTVSLRDLVFHEQGDPLAGFMEDRPISARSGDDQETVAQMFQKYDFEIMPVVDSEDRMLGIITSDDIMDVIQEEATEDITKMAAVTPENKPYPQTTVLDEIKRRVPWLLLLLMLSATFTGAIITHFEDALSRSIVLTAFMPMLMDTGGNAGGQASTMIIRALSLNEIKFRDYFKVIWKEFRVAFCCGVILAGANFVKMMLVDRVTPLVGAVVCITLVVTVVCAKFIGATLPILANRIGLDPAVMANPLITTITDTVSLLVYFEIATAMLGL